MNSDLEGSAEGAEHHSSKGNRGWWQQESHHHLRSSAPAEVLPEDPGATCERAGEKSSAASTSSSLHRGESCPNQPGKVAQRISRSAPEAVLSQLCTMPSLKTWCSLVRLLARGFA